MTYIKVGLSTKVKIEIFLSWNGVKIIKKTIPGSKHIIMIKGIVLRLREMGNVELSNRCIVPIEELLRF